MARKEEPNQTELMVWRLNEATRKGRARIDQSSQIGNHLGLPLFAAAVRLWFVSILKYKLSPNLLLLHPVHSLPNFLIAIIISLWPKPSKRPISIYSRSLVP